MSRYDRLHPNDYKSGRRAILYELIGENPGIAFTELRHRSGLHNGVLDYHLHTLERADLITSFKVVRERKYYATGCEDHAADRVHAYVTSPKYAKIMEELTRRGGSSTVELMPLFPEISRQSVSYRLAKLHEYGALERERRDRRIVYTPTDLATQAMRSHQVDDQAGPPVPDLLPRRTDME